MGFPTLVGLHKLKHITGDRNPTGLVVTRGPAMSDTCILHLSAALLSVGGPLLLEYQVSAVLASIVGSVRG